MSTLTTQDSFSKLFDAAPASFATQRQLAKESFLAQGMPGAKAEEYKFTQITKKLESSLTDISSALPFAIKTLDTVDANTIDADDVANGSMMPVEWGGLDSDGNLIIYVCFVEPTVGTWKTA